MARFLLMSMFALAVAGILTSAFSYTRMPAGRTIRVRLSEVENGATPQQVHVSMVGDNKMRISWISDDKTQAKLCYGKSPGSCDNSASGTTSSYRYILYESGLIHEVVIGPLEPDTVYYYRCGSSAAPERSLKTTPAHFPVKFAVVGDLGQTDWTRTTLQHIADSDYDMLLLPGDLSYADRIQSLWDSFGLLVEPLASQRPWMVTQGNHETEKIPLIHRTPFTAYNARWRMPFEESGSNSNLYYSFNVAGGVHVIMLGSYTDFDPRSAQYGWLQSDLAKVDRAKTPWMVVLIHAPWYNSNQAHQGEAESVEMKESMEEMIYKARVDVVFAGHVHAYERFTRVYQDKADNCAPMYINIGDGGNREGLATEYINPKPDISVFREASFGHGQFQVMNASHSLWVWNRNDDDVKVASDSIWLTSLSSNPSCMV